MTPHISAQKNEIAKVVLMPGDPLRAKWIAETFLENAKLVNEVRGMYCYTGTYQGIQVSIMGHGMGIPSIGIYSYELYKFYDVDLIIRIGSAGSYDANFKINDVFLVDEAYSESTYAELLGIKGNVLKPTLSVNQHIIQQAQQDNIALHVGRTHSSDVFYRSIPVAQLVEKTHAQCVEMESFALFANATLLNKQAATILTCSDSLVTHESLDANLRQTSFKNMVQLALNTIYKYSLEKTK